MLNVFIVHKVKEREKKFLVSILRHAVAVYVFEEEYNVLLCEWREERAKKKREKILFVQGACIFMGLRTTHTHDVIPADSAERTKLTIRSGCSAQFY
jgi:hypothetical protein